MNIVGTERNSILLKVYIDTNMDKDFSILSKSQDIFLLSDLEGNIVYVSHACESFVGFRRMDLMLMKLSDLFVPMYLDQTGAFFTGREQERIDNFDSQVKVKNGDILDVNVTSLPVFFEEDFLGSYLVLKDITEIKMRRRKMEQAKMEQAN
jgi:PAS domain S-box-containing protein